MGINIGLACTGRKAQGVLFQTSGGKGGTPNAESKSTSRMAGGRNQVYE